MTGNESPLPPDRRVRRTRDAIRRAFVDLMLEKGYDALTVADIINRADIGRSTFYAHFTNKQHVLQAALDDLTQRLRAQHHGGAGELFGFSRTVFEHVHQQRELLRAFLGRRSTTVVRNQVQEVLADLVRSDLANAGSSDIPTELVVDGVVGAYLALVMRCLDQGESHTPEQLDEAFRRLIVPGVTAALLECT